jgi:hypothetical protein
MTTSDLLVDVLITLVESIAGQPRRVLFKGVSSLSNAFREQVTQEARPWHVMVTGQDADFVSA